MIEPSGVPGVFRDARKLFTRNLVPGMRVYGEGLLRERGTEYREWVHTRSKLAAYLKLGGRFFPFSEGSRVLYLDAANGTTASHISDVVTSGTVYCVEISARSFRDLVMICDLRENMVPLMADATRPSSFGFAVDVVDVVYQDVAQRGQASILARNMEHFNARHGMLALKSRSEDVSMAPARAYREAETALRSRGLRVMEVLPLEPYERDHAMMVVERP